MAYVDSLQKVTIETVEGTVECVGCSYNGISFFVDESQSSGGRNVVSTALPFTNSHVNEDLGGQIKQFSLRIYILGDDAEAKRSELEAAFDAEGPFELVHMYYGKFQARCTSYSFTHTSYELAYIEGDVSFVPEEDPKAVARASEDIHGMTEEKVSKSLADVAAKFAENFKIIGKANSVVTVAVDAANDILDAIEVFRNSMRDFERFVLNVSQLRDNLTTIMKTPEDFANRFQDILTMTKETAAFNDDDFTSYTNEALLTMTDIDVNDGPTTSDETAAEIQRMALMTSAGFAVRCVVNSNYKNVIEVHETEEALNAAFEIAMSKVNDVNDYTNLADMLSIALKFLRDVKSHLAIIVEKPLNDIGNILAVCFDCYGNLEKVEDIIARNDVSDPSAIDREFLKVLSK